MATRASSQNRHLEPITIKIIRRRVLRWGRANFAPFPWRHPHRLWHGLVAEVLLQRTRASSALKVYDQLVARYPEPEKLADERLRTVRSLVKPLGLPIRAQQLRELAKAIVAIGGTPPADLGLLKALPAIGPYAAAAFLSMHFGKRHPIIDANIVRWICRLVGEPYHGETRRQPWLRDLVDRLTPKRNVRAYNFAVLDFTMSVCSVRPKCRECPIGPDLCIYGRQTLHGHDTLQSRKRRKHS